MSSAAVTIHTHEMLSEGQRERRCPDAMNDRAYSTRKNASYVQRDHRGRVARGWSATCYNVFGPGWLMPRVMATVTGSIVWGIYGRMSDMPEY